MEAQNASTTEKKSNKEKDSEKEKDKDKDKKQQKAKLDPKDDPRNYDFPEEFGNVYIEFTSVNEAKRARRNIHLLKYNKKTVECEYHDETKFLMNDFKRLEPIQREARAQEFEGVENLAIEFTEPRESAPL